MSEKEIIEEPEPQVVKIAKKKMNYTSKPRKSKKEEPVLCIETVAEDLPACINLTEDLPKCVELTYDKKKKILTVSVHM